MVHYRLFLLLTVIQLFSCQTEDPLPRLSDLELLSAKWELEKVIVNDIEYFLVDENYEVLGYPEENIGFEVFRKRFNYAEDYTYYIDWLKLGDYGLGTSTEKNWQPSAGFFSFFPENSRIVHNPGTPYEMEYTIIQLNEQQFIRQSERQMTRESPEWNWEEIFHFAGQFWSANETVNFQEVFKKL